MNQSSDRFQPVYDLLRGIPAENVCLKYGIGKKELNKRLAEYQQYARQVAMIEELPAHRISRNAPCPCGSGKKYKKCCLPVHESIRKNMPQDYWLKKQEQAKQKQFLEKETGRAFDFLAELQFHKARKLAEKLLQTFPEDDRLHDVLYTTAIVDENYDEAFYIARKRWQVALEEKDYYQEHGRHRREQQGHIALFYSPTTWLEKFWVAQRARHYAKEFPKDGNTELQRLANSLLEANNKQKYTATQEAGFEERRKALKPVIDALIGQGERSIPYVLPLAYWFNWASLFVPEIIAHSGSEKATRLLAELSMFRYPFFAQLCLKELERFGSSIVPVVADVINDHKSFDELKVGLILLLGNIGTEESFSILVRLTEHESPYVVNWVAQALAKHRDPRALEYLEKAKERLGELSKIAGAIRELVELKESHEAGN